MSFWAVYVQLLHRVQLDPHPPDVGNVPQSEAKVEDEHSRTQDDPPMPLLPGLQDLRFGQEAAGPQAPTQLIYAGGLQVAPVPYQSGAQRNEQAAEALEAHDDDGSDSNDDTEPEDEEGDETDEERFYAPLTDLRDDL